MYPTGSINGAPRRDAAMLAIAEFNQAQSNFRFYGYPINTFGESSGAVTGLVALLQPGATIGPLIGIVGPARSSVSQVVSVMAEVFQLPLLSYSSTDPTLSDKVDYPYFSRVCPSDAAKGEVLSKIFAEFGWTSQVGVVSTSDPFGIGGASAFLRAAAEVGVRVISQQVVPVNGDDASIHDALAPLRASGTRFIFAQLDAITAFRVLRAADDLQLFTPRRQWFISDLSESMFNGNTTLMARALGSLGVINRAGSGPLFEAFEQRFFNANKTLYPDSNTTNTFVPYAYDAVTTFALTAEGLRNDAVAVTAESIFGRLREVRFDGLTGRVTFQNFSGDRQTADFTVLNLQAAGAVVDVGVYLGKNDSFDLDLDAIVFSDGTNRVPEVDVPSSEEDDSAAGLGPGAVAGVAVGAVAFACCLLVLCLLAMLLVFLGFVVVPLLLVVVVVVVIVAFAVSLSSVLGGYLTVRSKERRHRQTLEYQLQSIAVETAVPVESGVQTFSVHALSWDDIKLEKKLGSGAFGKVYRGTWRGIPVAIKVLDSYAVESVADFMREAEVMTKLGNHPNCVTCIGAITEGARFGLISELAELGSLDHYMDKTAEGLALSKLRVVRIMHDTACGVEYLHSEGVVHRDIARRNVLVKENGHVLLADFGLSRFLKDKGSTAATTNSNVGPVKWSAPESMVPPRRYSFKSDTFMFGVFMWECVTRQVPWDGIDALEVLRDVPAGKRLKIPKKGVIPDLRTLIAQCWMPDEDDRPHMKEIIRTLRRVYQNLGGEDLFDTEDEEEEEDSETATSSSAAERGSAASSENADDLQKSNSSKSTRTSRKSYKLRSRAILDLEDELDETAVDSDDAEAVGNFADEADYQM